MYIYIYRSYSIVIIVYTFYSMAHSFYSYFESIFIIFVFLCHPLPETPFSRCCYFESRGLNQTNILSIEPVVGELIVKSPYELLKNVICVYIYMYIFVYVYIYVYIYTYMYTYVWVLFSSRRGEVESDLHDRNLYTTTNECLQCLTTSMYTVF